MHSALILSQTKLKTEKETDILTEMQRQKLVDFCTSPSKRKFTEEKGN